MAAHADAETTTETAEVAITPASPAKTQRFEKSEKNGANRELNGGAKGDRTPDLGIANAALSQLSYRPYRISAPKPQKATPRQVTAI